MFDFIIKLNLKKSVYFSSRYNIMVTSNEEIYYENDE